MNKKISKIKQSVKKPINKLTKRDSSSESKPGLPYITNDTVAEHREEVLAGARKYIYPLQHSKHRIVWLSVSIFIITFVVFMTYAFLSLYRFQNTSTFIYRVTQIMPFPIARVDGRFVAYENYLFELRRNMHYYQNQQKVNFSTDEGREQLDQLKKSALQQVIDDAYVKILADENGINVSVAELEKEVDIMSKQDRLGPGSHMLEDVLRDYWGWSVNDFKRAYRQQILARKVVSKLDIEAHSKANQALNSLKSGVDFKDVVSQYSEDEATKENGGEYGVDISPSTKDISAKVTDVIFSQQPGTHSGIIDADYTLEIVKTISIENDKAKAAHIQINFKNIEEYIAQLKESDPPRNYVSI